MAASPKLKPRDIRPIHCLVGEDLYLKLRFLSEIKEAIFSGGDSTLNYEYLLGDETDAATILDSSRTAAWGLFSNSSAKSGGIDRLVVVDQAEKLPSGSWQNLQDYLSDPESGTCLVFLVNREQKKWTPKKYFSPKHIKNFPLLKGKRLMSWARKEAAGKKLDIPEDVLNKLILAAEGNTGSIAGEMEKLYLYKGGGGVITPDDIVEVVGIGQEGNIFDLTGLIVSRKTDKALRLLSKLLDSGEPPLKIFALMVRAFRQLWKGSDIWEKTGDRRASCQAAGVYYYQEDFMRQLKKLKSGDIPYIYRRLVETDDALKGGEKLPRLALERLIIELST